MKQKIYKIFSTLFKNLLAFLAGGALGIAGTLLLAEPLLSHTIKKDIGLGIIAVAPVLILLYLIMFGVAGGAAGVIIYNLFRFFKRIKSRDY